jgi:hypothetical protein
VQLHEVRAVTGGRRVGVTDYLGVDFTLFLSGVVAGLNTLFALLKSLWGSFISPKDYLSEGHSGVH